MSYAHENEDDDLGYSAQVGERLRSIRKQKRLSLHDVEAQSYARVQGVGARRLRTRRARTVAAPSRPPGAVLPGTRRPAAAAPRRRSGRHDEGTGPRPKLAIDILKLTQLSGAPFEMLTRFLRMIQVQRQDFNGRVLTIRQDDKRAIAAMLDIPVDQVALRLEALDLVFRPN